MQTDTNQHPTPNGNDVTTTSDATGRNWEDPDWA